jgi:hypothetical protein
MTPGCPAGRACCRRRRGKIAGMDRQTVEPVSYPAL